MQKVGVHSSYFPRRKVAATEERRSETLRLIEENDGISTMELAKTLNVVSSTLRRHTLQPLAIDGQIHSEPANHWHIGKKERK